MDAGILRRLASIVYESLLLAALWFVAGFVFVPLAGGQDGLMRAVFQLYLLAVTGTYFVWFWTHGGQTLAMKTWGLRIETASAKPLTAGRATLRFLVAVPCVLSAVGLLWVVADRDRRFLHDRLAGTRIVETNPRS